MACEFTKGPYFLTEDGYIRMALGERRLYIANTVGIPNKDGGDKATKANGQLLAASYELLEALRELSYLEPLCDDGDPLLTAAREKAKAAISKAEGK